MYSPERFCNGAARRDDDVMRIMPNKIIVLISPMYKAHGSRLMSNAKTIATRLVLRRRFSKKYSVQDVRESKLCVNPKAQNQNYDWRKSEWMLRESTDLGILRTATSPIGQKHARVNNALWSIFCSNWKLLLVTLKGKAQKFLGKW